MGTGTFTTGETVVPEAAHSGRVDGPMPAGDWTRVIGRLKDEVGETAYRSWLRSMRLDRIENGEGVVAVPTSFLRNWVATHYADRLLALWRSENGAVTRLSIIVEPQIAGRAAVEEDDEPTAESPAFAEPPRTGVNYRRSIRASPSRILSSASPTSWPTPPPAASPRPASRRSTAWRSTRCSFMAGSASARPI